MLVRHLVALMLHLLPASGMEEPATARGGVMGLGGIVRLKEKILLPNTKVAFFSLLSSSEAPGNGTLVLFCLPMKKDCDGLLQFPRLHGVGGA